MTSTKSSSCISPAEQLILSSVCLLSNFGSLQQTLTLLLTSPIRQSVGNFGWKDSPVSFCHKRCPHPNRLFVWMLWITTATGYDSALCPLLKQPQKLSLNQHCLCWFSKRQFIFHFHCPFNFRQHNQRISCKYRSLWCYHHSSLVGNVTVQN